MATKKDKKTKAKVAEEIVEEVAEQEQTAEVNEPDVVEEVEAVEELDELTVALKQIEELSDKHLRLQAEFDNYRKRTLKEKMELIKTAGEGLINGMLPVMDDFERAMDTIEKADNLDILKEGMVLIYNKFEAFFKQNGVQAIPTDNEELDTDKHDAITQIPAPSKKMKGKIIDCVQKGYTLNDKVIRHSKVVVGA